MKTVIALITLLSVFSAAPILGAEKEKAVPSINERLKQADLNVALKHYEKVRLLAHEASLQLALLETGNDKSKAELTRRIEILEKHADQLRQIAAECDAEIRKYREVAAAAK